MKNSYEIMILFNPALTDNIINEKTDKIKEFIEKHDGEIKNVLDNGIDSISYEINKSKQAHVIIMEFIIPPSNIEELKKEINLEENIWRFFIKKEENR